jgi:hypothetical protein
MTVDQALLTGIATHHLLLPHSAIRKHQFHQPSRKASAYGSLGSCEIPDERLAEHPWVVVKRAIRSICAALWFAAAEVSAGDNCAFRTA